MECRNGVNESRFSRKAIPRQSRDNNTLNSTLLRTFLLSTMQSGRWGEKQRWTAKDAKKYWSEEQTTGDIAEKHSRSSSFLTVGHTGTSLRESFFVGLKRSQILLNPSCNRVIETIPSTHEYHRIPNHALESR